MKDEITHKFSLFRKYLPDFGEEEISKRLGLKQWERDYFRTKYKNTFSEDASLSKRPIQENSGK